MLRHVLNHGMWLPLCLLLVSSADAQRLTQDPDVLQSRIGDQRVQRQTEIMRLERMMEEMDSRLIRLERQQLRAARLPAITVAEAEAVVEFAQTRLDASQFLFESGKGDQVQVASDRLALVRAQGQLDAAKAAQQENLLLMELEVAYAQDKLLDLKRERELTQRLAAKQAPHRTLTMVWPVPLTAATKPLILSNMCLMTLLATMAVSAMALKPAI